MSLCKDPTLTRDSPNHNLKQLPSSDPKARPSKAASRYSTPLGDACNGSAGNAMATFPGPPAVSQRTALGNLVDVQREKKHRCLSCNVICTVDEYHEITIEICPLHQFLCRGTYKVYVNMWIHTSITYMHDARMPVQREPKNWDIPSGSTWELRYEAVPEHASHASSSYPWCCWHQFTVL